MSNLCKNDRVAFRTSERSNRIYGHRRMTSAEVEAWYDMYKGQMRDDGESYICSNWTTVDLNGVYTVVRARCAPQIGWYKYSNMVEVMGDDGVRLYVKRDYIAGIARA